MPSSSSAVAAPLPPSRSVAPQDGAKGPESISFISADEGWALGPGTCTGCARIWHTADGGRRWATLTSTVRLPGDDSSAVVEGLAGLDFVNNEDGYLFVSSHCTGPCALITVDGGRTWRSAAAPETGQVTTAGPQLYALTGNGIHPTELLRTSAGSRRFTRLVLPTISSTGTRGFTIAADHETVAVLQIGSAHAAPLGATPTPAERGALWISTTEGSAFRRVNIPCHGSDGGAAVVSVALDHPHALLLDCYNGQQSSQEQTTQHHLYGSGDDGLTWDRLADPSDTGGPGTLADNGGRHAFLVSEGGTGYQLHVSLDGATHWHVVLRGGTGGFGLAGPDFISASTGFALGPTHYASEHIYRTTDAGRSWQQLPLPIR